LFKLGELGRRKQRKGEKRGKGSEGEAAEKRKNRFICAIRFFLPRNKTPRSTAQQNTAQHNKTQHSPSQKFRMLIFSKYTRRCYKIDIRKNKKLKKRKSLFNKR